MATVNKDFIVKNGVVAGDNVQGTQLVSTTSSLPPLTVTSSANVANLNADFLDGLTTTNLLDWNNTTNKPSPIIGVQLTGDVAGTASATLTELGNGQISITTVISDDSHNHSFAASATYAGSAVFANSTYFADYATTSGSVDWSGISNVPDPVIGVSLTGEVTGAASATLTDLSNGQISITTSITAGTVDLGTDTSGDYVDSISGGTGVTVTGGSGEGSTPSIAIGQDVATNATPQFVSLTLTETSGSPLTLSSSAQINNLNANFLGGYTAEEIISSGGVQSVIGTNNEIEVSASVGNIQIGLPDNVVLGGSLTVGENLIVSGSVVTVNSTVVTIEDPIFTLGGADAGINDSKDRGVEFKWNDGTAKVGFFGFDDSTGKFTFIPDATNSGEVFSGTTGEIDAKVDWTNILNKPDSTVTLTGDVTGTGTMTDLGNVSFSTTVEKDFDITLTGDVSGNVTVSNLSSASISVTIEADSVSLGTDTTGNYVEDITASAYVLKAGSASEGQTAILSVDATPENTANKVVARDSSGNFSANIITASVTGNAGTATTLANSRKISLGGDLSGSATFDGSSDITINATVGADSVALGTDTTGDYVATITASANQINVSGSGEGSDIVLSLPQDINQNATPKFSGVDFDYGSITSASVLITQNSTDTTIDSFSATDLTTAEYLVQAKQGTKMTSEKIMIMWDGSDASISEYSIMDAAAGAANCTFTASYSGGNLYLIASSLDAASTNVAIKVVRTSVVA